MVLTFRIFFSNMSNLFKNNMKDVFCPQKIRPSLFTEIDTDVNCHIKETFYANVVITI